MYVKAILRDLVGCNIYTVNLLSLLLEQGNNTEEALSVNTSLNRTNG